MSIILKTKPTKELKEEVEKELQSAKADKETEDLKKHVIDTRTNKNCPDDDKTAGS